MSEYGVAEVSGEKEKCITRRVSLYIALHRERTSKLANQAVERCLRKDSATSVKLKEKRKKYNDYTPE